MDRTPASAATDGGLLSEPRRFQLGLPAFDFLEPRELDLIEPLIGARQVLCGGSTLVREGSPFHRMSFVVSGWGMRFKTLPDGARQIIGFALPGDTIGYFAHLCPRAGYGCESITAMTLLHIQLQQLRQTLAGCAPLAAALVRIAAREQRLLEEHVLRIGRRNAPARMAHLLVELHRRQRHLDAETAQLLPLTQQHLADALGMSYVYANRVFRDLARQGLVARRESCLNLLDCAALADLAAFDPAYLERRPAPLYA